MPSDSPTPVRLPADLRLWLKHAAIDNHRSLSGEIVHRLVQSKLHEEHQKEPSPASGLGEAI